MNPGDLLARIRSMSHEEMASTLVLLEELEARKRIALAQMDFLAFIAALDAVYKFGGHLKRLGGLLMQIEQGSKDRIAVSMGPRFGKSLMISVFFPAWYLGKHPDRKIIMASHTSDLAVDMARKVRNLMQTDEYKRIFPGVAIAADAKAAGKWNTTKGGEVYAVGTGGALAGRGAHLCLSGNALVAVEGREVRLSQVEVGQRILTAFGWQRVTHKILTIHKEWVKINGVEASLTHPFLTPNGWVEAGQLRVGDRIKTLTVWSRLWITASSLRKRLLARLGKA